MSRSLVTGATGFVGRRLVQRLERPVVLTRNPERAKRVFSDQIDAFHWDAELSQPPLNAFDQVSTIYHLAGEPIADGRWTKDKKLRLRESRVAGTRNLVEAIEELPVHQRPKALISASAVGYYGDRGNELLSEDSLPATDFLGEICVHWEKEAQRAAKLGVRVVLLRIGIVLGQGGGAIATMVPAFRSWAGSRLGSGLQWVPWIHLEDLVDLLLFVAKSEKVQGPVNAVSPNAVTNAEFTRTLAQTLGVPRLLPPVPGFALKAMFGEFGQVILASQHVVPKAATDAGFQFSCPNFADALKNILLKSDEVDKYATH